MAEVKVLTREGEEKVIAIEPGLSLMESITNAGFGDLLALCGGCCSCATCHVYIEPGFEGSLQAASDTENDLLDCSEFRTEKSRLSCQVTMSEDMDGMIVRIAPED